MLSNGGLIYGTRICRILAEQWGREPNLVVLDSCPSLELSIRVPATVASEVMAASSRWKFLAKPAYYVTYAALFLKHRLHPTLSEQEQRDQLAAYFGFHTLPLLQRARQVYLYSSGDKITNAALLEKFIQEKLDPTRTVAVNFGDNSPHVQHLRMNPKKYVDAICSSLD